MDGDDDGTSKFVRLDALESGREVVDLSIVENGVGCGGSGLGGDDAWIFEHIAIERQDAEEWGLEGEVDPRLDHGGSEESAGVCD